jgi:hypothetical protein
VFRLAAISWTAFGLPQQLRQFREIRRHAPGLVAGEHAGTAGSSGLSRK